MAVYFSYCLALRDVDSRFLFDYLAVSTQASNTKLVLEDHPVRLLCFWDEYSYWTSEKVTAKCISGNLIIKLICGIVTVY